MSGRIVAGIVVSFLLMGCLALAFSIRQVKANGTIYIKADGSIDPSTAPISTSDQSTYTFTDDVYDMIVVQRNNIVIDGNNHKVQGDGSSYGIDLRQRNNVTVKGVEVLRFESGICVHDASNIVLIDNKVSNSSRDGISGWRVSNSSFVNNVISNNEYDGIYIGEVPSDNNMIINNILSRNGASGIGLAGSKNCSLTNNTVSYNNLGIRLSYGAHQNVVMNNTIFSNNYWGICIDSSSNNSVICNTIKNNQEVGLAFWYPSSYNKIHHNNFIDNARQVDSYSGFAKNSWNSGYTDEGNYWSDYTGVDQNLDGIGDTPIVIDVNNTDCFPLMGMFSSFGVTSEHCVQTICNSTMLDFQFDGAAIRFNISGENGTAGFCRICVPQELMSEPYHVFVNGTEILPPPQPLPCSNSTHNYLYFNYTHSTKEITIIPEFPSFLVLSVFMITAFAAFIVHKRKHLHKVEMEISPRFTRTETEEMVNDVR